MGLKLGNFARNRFKEILNKTSFSAATKDNLTRISITRTKDSGGRVTNVTETETTISGFIGYVTSKDRSLVEQGFVSFGDATLFVEQDTTLDLGDEIKDEGSVRWEITKLVQEPRIQGLVTHKRYALKRRD